MICLFASQLHLHPRSKSLHSMVPFNFSILKLHLIMQRDVPPSLRQGLMRGPPNEPEHYAASLQDVLQDFQGRLQALRGKQSHPARDTTIRISQSCAELCFMAATLNHSVESNNTAYMATSALLRSSHLNSRLCLPFSCGGVRCVFPIRLFTVRRHIHSLRFWACRGG